MYEMKLTMGEDKISMKKEYKQKNYTRRPETKNK